MNEFINVLLINAGILVILAIGYYWGLATKEVRYENEIKRINEEVNSLDKFIRSR